MIHEIKLIEIHRRNIKHLRAQKAKLGLHCPPHIKNQLDSEKKSVAELEGVLRRRRQLLLEKAALKGINTDPEISIEIEDINKYFDDLGEGDEGLPILP